MCFIDIQRAGYYLFKLNTSNLVPLVVSNFLHKCLVNVKFNRRNPFITNLSYRYLLIDAILEFDVQLLSSKEYLMQQNVFEN